MNVAGIYQIFKQYPLITTDSRNCPTNSIFIALKGTTFNGNMFAKAALEKGCAYAIVDEAKYVVDDKIILVDDCLTTLQQLANFHRKQLMTPIIAITGTNGKTTTKELIAAILSRQYNILYTEGNLNNHIGVPLTLLRLTSNHELAVVEMGASKPGDIKELVEIVQPDYGLITNVGKAHLEGFGSYQGVVSTKGELYDYLKTKKNSVVFVNYEDAELVAMSGGLNQIFYGEKDSLYINGKAISSSPFLAFQWRSGKNGDSHQVQTKLIGEYNFNNVLAAVTIGKFFAVKAEKIDSALIDYIPQNNRSQLVESSNNKLIVDAYNANPTSMAAAIENFKKVEASHKMVILGDMKELGEASQEEHQRILDYLTECRFDIVWLVGDQFAGLKPSFPVFPNVSYVIEKLKDSKPKGYYILIKGSNSLKLTQLGEYL